MSHTNQILLAFVLGQVLQVVLHGLGEKLVSANPLLVCIIVGLLVTTAFYIGVLLANREQSGMNFPLEEVFGDEVKTD